MVSMSRVPHILVVDDTPEILDLLEELLVEEHFRVSTFRVPLDHHQVKALAPDAIVQDLLFAGSPEPGWEFLAMIRGDPDLAAVPLLLCTGANEIIRDPAVAARLDRLAVRVLSKPFDIDEFLGALTAALETQPRSAPALAPKLEQIVL